MFGVIILAWSIIHTSSGAEVHWTGAPHYVIDQAGRPEVGAGAFGTINTSFNSWSAVCSIGYVYDGTTTKSYTSVYSGGTPIQNQETTDGTNYVGWIPG